MTETIVRDFRRHFHFSDVWNHTYWRGVPIFKYATDIQIYHEIIWETRPEVIVECGAGHGGSALFFCDMQTLYGPPCVASIDVNAVTPRSIFIRPFRGDSVDGPIIASVHEYVNGRRAMVVLDSDHRTAHVSAEIAAYSPLVSIGCYLCVEDTIIPELPLPDYGNGPRGAVEQFLAVNDCFERDENRERFMLTSNEGGYLRRVK